MLGVGLSRWIDSKTIQLGIGSARLGFGATPGRLDSRLEPTSSPSRGNTSWSRLESEPSLF
ncbi:hypothetical protein BS47DRAFT_569746 [Hydnum rufescens UP504]|uniref:Uncharacterized protein n=1 Tax=Hydnum rufescens UP504 TaxID=1448309 RepID=A0A9P6B3M2_9AGAM|nr:hypothetical protein BS47DRAFT_569746 [Hydnum rufescens UP504]